MTSMPSVPKSYILRSGEGRRLSASFDGDSISVKAGGSGAASTVAFVEYSCAPMSKGPKPHTHAGHEELFYVIDGALDMLIGEEMITCNPGDFAFAPREVKHTFMNPRPSACIFVAVFSPAGFEQIFERRSPRIESGSRFTYMEELELAREFGMSIVP